MSMSCINCGQSNNLVRCMSHYSTYDTKFYMCENMENFKIMCKSCYLRYIDEDKEDHETWYTCKCCNISYEEDLFYQCEKCGENVCSINCIKVTGCQTNSCICKLCFHGKCVECNQNIINNDLDVYLWDGDIEHQPLCDSCKK